MRGRSYFIAGIVVGVLIAPVFIGLACRFSARTLVINDMQAYKSLPLFRVFNNTTLRRLVAERAASVTVDLSSFIGALSERDIARVGAAVETCVKSLVSQTSKAPDDPGAGT